MRRRFDAPAARSGRAGVLVLVLLAFAAAAGAWWYFAPQSMPGWLARKIPAAFARTAALQMARRAGPFAGDGHAAGQSTVRDGSLRSERECRADYFAEELKRTVSHP
jgi:hypothetical protein